MEQPIRIRIKTSRIEIEATIGDISEALPHKPDSRYSVTIASFVDAIKAVIEQVVIADNKIKNH